MSFSHILNGPKKTSAPQMNVPRDMNNAERQFASRQENVYQANTSHLHDTTANTGDPFSRLNQPLEGSTLVPTTHLRSPYGPDHPYRNIHYENMDGLIYRFYNHPDEESAAPMPKSVKQLAQKNQRRKGTPIGQVLFDKNVRPASGSIPQHLSPAMADQGLLPTTAIFDGAELESGETYFPQKSPQPDTVDINHGEFFQAYEDLVSCGSSLDASQHNQDLFDFRNHLHWGSPAPWGTLSAVASQLQMPTHTQNSSDSTRLQQHNSQLVNHQHPSMGPTAT